jgi:hypothetical protein
VAAQYADVETIRLLLKSADVLKALDPEALNLAGKTPRDVAAARSAEEPDWGNAFEDLVRNTGAHEVDLQKAGPGLRQDGLETGQKPFYQQDDGQLDFRNGVTVEVIEVDSDDDDDAEEFVDAVENLVLT